MRKEEVEEDVQTKKGTDSMEGGRGEWRREKSGGEGQTITFPRTQIYLRSPPLPHRHM